MLEFRRIATINVNITGKTKRKMTVIVANSKKLLLLKPYATLIL